MPSHIINLSKKFSHQCHEHYRNKSSTYYIISRHIINLSSVTRVHEISHHKSREHVIIETKVVHKNVLHNLTSTSISQKNSVISVTSTYRVHEISHIINLAST